MIFELTEDNFVIYAIKHYDNPNCRGMNEFLDDLKRFKYLKRLFRKYSAGKGLKERLIINHIVVLYNVFGVEAATRMLFFKLDDKDYEVIRPILIFLNFISGDEIVYGINGKNILTNKIKFDEGTLKCLKILLKFRCCQ